MDNGVILGGLAAAPIIVALVSVFIKPFVKDVRFYAPASILMAIGWTVALAVRDATGGVDWITAVMLGVVVGLAASGLYSTGSTVGLLNKPPDA